MRLVRTIDFVKFAETKNAALLTFSSAWIIGTMNQRARPACHLVTTSHSAQRFFSSLWAVWFVFCRLSRRCWLSFSRRMTTPSACYIGAPRRAHIQALPSYSICEALQTLMARGASLVSTSLLQDLPTSIQRHFRAGKVSSTFWAIGARLAASEVGSRPASARIFTAVSLDRIHAASVNLLSEKYSKQVRNVRARPMTLWFGNPVSLSHRRKWSHHSLLLKSRRWSPSKIKSAAMPAISHRTSSSCFSNHSRIACKGVLGIPAAPVRLNGTTFSSGGMRGQGLPFASHKTRRPAIAFASSGDLVRQSSLSASPT
ncbi:hypothetical protein ACVILK_003331 [Bradyrhizobium embrapense]